MYDAQLATYALGLLLGWLHPDPRNIRRLEELEVVAEQIAETGAAQDEAHALAAIAVHESHAHLGATGRKGERGPWQVMPPGSPHATHALYLLRKSVAACGTPALYAGCGGCRCPAGILESMLDPTLPRR